MYCSCRFTIDLYFCIRHRAIKHYKNLFPFPGSRNRKVVFVKSLFISETEVLTISLIITTIVISSKPLLFPTGRHCNGCPVAALASISTKEIPGNSVVVICTGEVLNLFYWL